MVWLMEVQVAGNLVEEVCELGIFELGGSPRGQVSG